MDGAFTLIECAGCGSLFQPEPVLPDPITEWFFPDRLQYFLEVHWTPLYSAGLLAQLWRPEGCRFLYLGCALGVTVDIAINVLGWSAMGIGTSATASEGRMLFGPYVDRGWLDPDELPDGPFDVILIADPIRSCDNPRQLLEAVRARLAEGGTLLVETQARTQLESPDATLSKARATLMPAGFCAFLPSLLGMEEVIRASGFCDAVSVTENGLVRSWSGPLRIGTETISRQAEFVERYLNSLRLRNAKGDPLWNAATAHLFSNRVDAGATIEAQYLLAEMADAWRARFDIDPTRPGLIASPPLHQEDTTPPTRRYPLVLSRVLSDQARNIRNTPGTDPLQALAYDRKAYALAIETACFGVKLGESAGPANSIARRTRAAMIDTLGLLVPELRYDLIGGAARPSGTVLDAILEPRTGIGNCAKIFMLAVQEGRYWDATRLEHLFEDIAIVRNELADDPVSLCMMIYCLGVLALNVHADVTRAAALFQTLATTAEEGGTTVSNFADLAQSHIALTRSMLLP